MRGLCIANLAMFEPRQEGPPTPDDLYSALRDIVFRPNATIASAAIAAPHTSRRFIVFAGLLQLPWLFFDHGLWQRRSRRHNILDGPGLFFWTTGNMKDRNHTNFANPASGPDAHL